MSNALSATKEEAKDYYKFMKDIEQRKAELWKKANRLSQTAKNRPVDSESFQDYREGFLDGERLMAKETMEIIGSQDTENQQLKIANQALEQINKKGD